MNFRKATDELLAGISHQELADALGVSVATVRQARLSEGSKARRSPPDGWERVVVKMAEKQAEHFQKLANKIATTR
jgi:hypothetical protein